MNPNPKGHLNMTPHAIAAHYFDQLLILADPDNIFDELLDDSYLEHLNTTHDPHSDFYISNYAADIAITLIYRLDSDDMTIEHFAAEIDTDLTAYC